MLSQMGQLFNVYVANLFYNTSGESCKECRNDAAKLVEEKGEKSGGIWDLHPGAMEKAEHAFSGQP
ncbi:hypothetical protein T458_21820 [Brevibacillus panacihumi W25]|uniref:Uncharacterized protein n=1 Tax=Brevibacillus panacihumi W25 TaxID=1408254 RepID=V6M7S0_9BACL|nr:hypothetical protein T458_21820 [Brevibacillus panacihumi W25]